MRYYDDYGSYGKSAEQLQSGIKNLKAYLRKSITLLKIFAPTTVFTGTVADITNSGPLKLVNIIPFAFTAVFALTGVLAKTELISYESQLSRKSGKIKKLDMVVDIFGNRYYEYIGKRKNWEPKLYLGGGYNKCWKRGRKWDAESNLRDAKDKLLKLAEEEMVKK